MNKLNLMKYLFLILSVQFFYAQEDSKIAEILSKSNEQYQKKESLAVSLSYKLYSTYSSNFVTESYEGITVNSNKDNYIRIHNTEFINTSKLALKINHDQKLVLLIPSSSVPQNSPLNVEDYIKYFKTKKLQSIGNEWIIEFQTSTLTQLPYGKVKIYIEKGTYKIKKQVLYLLEKVPYKEKGVEKTNTPRLEIVFSEKKLSEAEVKSLFNIDNIVLKEGESYKLARKYIDYKLLIN
ncbi:hypothetical protein NHF50_09980 [Flavobacterium sp. NRK F10]|uniref:hypothetical protein n=1 Tax=Flavobacterium sp. NRK F10 TaxID=2954931 RepID=UPI0020911F4A|nr:hypothetical protein [Flavobacterium sp. NRK F10]MCO6175371.1 hypothetical protein [Flavobacterium sp. NRK F10]